MRRGCVIALLLLAVACGKYGPPVRSQPQPAPAPAAEAPADPDEEKKK